MLGKLMKYEWRGYRFPILVMLAILAGTTLLTCAGIFSFNPKYDEAVTGFSILTMTLSILLFYFGIIGCTVGTMLIICIRFYKTCYTDQGYLTHTLPVSSKQLLNAKIISAVCAYLLIFLCIVISFYAVGAVFVFHFTSFDVNDAELLRREVADVFTEVIADFKDDFGISFGGFLTLYIFSCIVFCISGIISSMGCVSLGQLYAKHRIIGAIVAYFVLQTVMQIFCYIAMIPMYSRMLSNTSAQPIEFFLPTIIIMLVLYGALGIGMYFANLHMMTKKLNLE